MVTRMPIRLHLPLDVELAAAMEVRFHQPDIEAAADEVSDVVMIEAVIDVRFHQPDMDADCAAVVLVTNIVSLQVLDMFQ